MKDEISNELRVGDLVLAIPCDKIINKDFKMYALVAGENQIFISKNFNNDNFTVLDSNNYKLYKLDLNTNAYLKEVHMILSQNHNRYSLELLSTIKYMKKMRPGTIIETYDKKNKYWIYLGTGTLKFRLNYDIFEEYGYVYITLASFLNANNIVFKEQNLDKYSAMFDIDKVLEYAARNSHIHSVFHAVELPKIIKNIKGNFDIANISVDRYYYSVEITADIYDGSVI